MIEFDIKITAPGFSKTYEFKEKNPLDDFNELTLNRMIHCCAPAVIYCNYSYLYQMVNSIFSTPKDAIISQDTIGYVGKYKGTSVYVYDDLFANDDQPHAIVVPKPVE